MPAQIRLATIDDYGALAALWLEGDSLHHSALPDAFRQPVDPVRSRDWVGGILADPQAAIIVATSDGQVVGLLHVVERSVLNHPILIERRFALIDSIVVARAAQHSGIGRELMAQAESWAQGRGLAEIELSVWEFNLRARSFYEELGYLTLSRRMGKPLRGVR
jgi:diamine N-acetyltransferase